MEYPDQKGYSSNAIRNHFYPENMVSLSRQCCRVPSSGNNILIFFKEHSYEIEKSVLQFYGWVRTVILHSSSGNNNKKKHPVAPCCAVEWREI